MKISKLAKLIKKKNKNVVKMLDDRGHIWIGTSEAIYPLYNMPLLSDEQILTLLDVPLEQHKSYYIKEISGENRKQLIKDINDTNNHTYDDFRNKTLVADDKDLYLLKIDHNVKVICKDYVDIIDMIDDPNSTFYYRNINNMIIISAGFSVVAVINEYQISELTVESLRKTLNMLECALVYQQKQKKAKENQELMQLDFDKLE